MRARGPRRLAWVVWRRTIPQIFGFVAAICIGIVVLAAFFTAVGFLCDELATLYPELCERFS